MGNGIPDRVLGNGEGFTTLVLTDAEARALCHGAGELEANGDNRAIKAYRAGVTRATARIKAEFDAEQKRKKEPKR